MKLRMKESGEVQKKVKVKIKVEGKMRTKVK